MKSLTVFLVAAAGLYAAYQLASATLSARIGMPTKSGFREFSISGEPWVFWFAVAVHAVVTVAAIYAVRKHVAMRRRL